MAVTKAKKAERKTADLQEFMEWVKTVRRDELEKWLADAFWKDQLVGTEIHRFFLLSQKGVDMRTTPMTRAGNPTPARKTRK